MMAILNNMEKSIDGNTQDESITGQSPDNVAASGTGLEKYLRESAVIDLSAIDKRSEIAVAVPSSEAESGSGNLQHGSFQLTVIDNIGHVISGLGLKLILKGGVVFVGKTNDDGAIFIENLPIGENIEIHVKADSGGYKQIAIAMIGARENVASLRSPKVKIELESICHQGDPGEAIQEKEKTIQKHNQNPVAEPQIIGKQRRKPDLKVARNEEGHPVARVGYGVTDWFGLNRINPSRWATVKGANANSNSGTIGTNNLASGVVKQEEGAEFSGEAFKYASRGVSNQI
jgi:hypothetical protein